MKFSPTFNDSSNAEKMYFYAIGRDFSVNLERLLEEFKKLGCSCHKAEDEEMPARHVLVKKLNNYVFI